MRHRVHLLARMALAGLLGLSLMAVPARAEEEDTGPFHEPGITYRTVQKPYLQWLAGSLLIAACLVVAFKNPHRSHMD